VIALRKCGILDNQRLIPVRHGVCLDMWCRGRILDLLATHPGAIDRCPTRRRHPALRPACLSMPPCTAFQRSVRPPRRRRSARRARLRLVAASLSVWWPDQRQALSGTLCAPRSIVGFSNITVRQAICSLHLAGTMMMYSCGPLLPHDFKVQARRRQQARNGAAGGGLASIAPPGHKFIVRQSGFPTRLHSSVSDAFRP